MSALSISSSLSVHVSWYALTRREQFGAMISRKFNGSQIKEFREREAEKIRKFLKSPYKRYPVLFKVNFIDYGDILFFYFKILRSSTASWIFQSPVKCFKSLYRAIGNGIMLRSNPLSAIFKYKKWSIFNDCFSADLPYRNFIMYDYHPFLPFIKYIK